MYNFNFNLFKHFYYVVYYKGFTNALKKLNIAQSALSYNVKTLENQIDKILIIRNSKNFDLTEDGYNLYETLKSVFGILEQNVQQFSDEKVYEEVTIGIRHYLSDFIFKDAIKEFVDKYPNIHLNIKLYSKLDIKKFDDLNAFVEQKLYEYYIKSNVKSYKKD
jgi:DNA-binding transcriptional LysR family regulator